MRLANLYPGRKAVQSRAKTTGNLYTMKKLALTSAFAIAVAFGGAAHAQGLQQGWNHVKPINCVFLPGTAATATQPAQGDQVQIYVNIAAETNPANGPPPVPDVADFSTSDPIAITLAAPFCKDGSAFYVYWDGQKAAYFSIYPK